MFFTWLVVCCKKWPQSHLSYIMKHFCFSGGHRGSAGSLDSGLVSIHAQCDHISGWEQNAVLDWTSYDFVLARFDLSTDRSQPWSPVISDRQLKLRHTVTETELDVSYNCCVYCHLLKVQRTVLPSMGDEEISHELVESVEWSIVCIWRYLASHEQKMWMHICCLCSCTFHSLFLVFSCMIFSTHHGGLLALNWHKKITWCHFYRNCYWLTMFSQRILKRMWSVCMQGRNSFV